MPNGMKNSILIVDDEKTNLDVLSHVLGDWYTLYIAKSGESALAKAAANKPDLILLDIVMPGMNGFEVIARLKENEETRNIPVIFITGLNSAGNEEKGILLGAADYIVKPFSPPIVKARVATQLKIQRQVRLFEKIGMLDPVTGVPNRKRFEIQRELEWEKAKQGRTVLGLLLLQLNGWAQCEAIESMLPADMFLLGFADVIKDTVKSATDSVFRIASDQFAVLTTGMEEAARRKEAIFQGFETLKKRYAECEPLKDLELLFGEAAMVPTENETVEHLVQEAEKRLMETA